MASAYMKLFVLALCSSYLYSGYLVPSAIAQETTKTEENNQIDLPPEVIKDSPVLQEWKYPMF